MGGGCIDLSPYNAARSITHGRCYDTTFSRVNNGIKTSRHTNLFRHCYDHILVHLNHGLNGNINFKIRFVFGKCNTRHLAIGTRSMFMFSNLYYFSLHVVYSISNYLMTRLYS